MDDYTFPPTDDISEGEAGSALPTPEELAERLQQEIDNTPPPTPSLDTSALRYADIQAKQIVEDANFRAKEIVEKRLREAEKEIESEKQKARSEGYRKGYEEGLVQARVEADVHLQEQFDLQERQIAMFLEKAMIAKEEMLTQTKSDLCDLSIAVAEKVIHVSLGSSREIIGKMIQVATEKLKRREWVRIYVSGESAKHLAEAPPELVSALAGISDNIKIIPMPGDEAGTCIIEMPDEIIDASASTQLNNIKSLITQG